MIPIKPHLNWLECLRMNFQDFGAAPANGNPIIRVSACEWHFEKLGRRLRMDFHMLLVGACESNFQNPSQRLWIEFREVQSVGNDLCIPLEFQPKGLDPSPLALHEQNDECWHRWNVLPSSGKFHLHYSRFVLPESDECKCRRNLATSAGKLHLHCSLFIIHIECCA